MSLIAAFGNFLFHEALGMGSEDANDSHRTAFNIAIPGNAKEVAECERDAARNLIGGAVAFLTPLLFEEVCRRPERESSFAGCVLNANRGDVNDTSVREAIADLREQLLEVIQDTISDADLFEKAKEIVKAGLVFPNFTIGPMLDFVLKVGLPPQISDQRFVIVLTRNSFRVATLGFVSETPGAKDLKLVRLVTENLVTWQASRNKTRIHVYSCVREVTGADATIFACLSQEVLALLAGSSSVPVDRLPLQEGADEAESPQDAESPACSSNAFKPATLLIAGVDIPATSVIEGTDHEANIFGVQVIPASGAEPWMIHRRYKAFYDLCTCINPATNQLAHASFPRKYSSRPYGARLEVRRRGLEIWLNEVVREAQVRQPDWLGPLSDFLEVRSRHSDLLLEAEQA